MGDGSVASFRWQPGRRLSARERLHRAELELVDLSQEEGEIRKEIARKLDEIANLRWLVATEQRTLPRYAGVNRDGVAGGTEDAR